MADIFTTSSPNEWWRGATFYQIYPRSFQDTNGDGVGDLKGITERLEYVASLNVDAIWLSPFFKSPMKDFGYDVSDYCDVDPIFGTIEDFEALFKRAKELGLKVIIDQVYSHTSDQHNWFLESRKSRTNDKADWYIWADAKPDGSPPNNWQAYFGGSSWQWDSSRKQYFMHNFLSSQPDLNLHHPKVQDALLDVTRFWLDRGVDGFRLDVVNCFMHDPELRDNPPSGRPIEEVVRSFDMQDHIYSETHHETVNFLTRMRWVLDGYEGNKFTVAEVSSPDPFKFQREYTSGHQRLNTSYNFDFLYLDHLTGWSIANSLSSWEGDPAHGWPSWAFSNHDAPRVLSRWSDGMNTVVHAKLYLLLLLSMRGTVFMYQGEELGLPTGNVPYEFLQDPEAIENWPHTLGRDGARTPFPWSYTEEYAGFTTGEPWLPVDPAHAALAPDVQEADEYSTLVFAREAIRLRRDLAPIRIGDLAFITAEEYLLAFKRKQGDETILCVFNLSNRPLEYDFELPEKRELIISNIGVEPHNIENEIPALTGYWWKI